MFRVERLQASAPRFLRVGWEKGCLVRMLLKFINDHFRMNNEEAVTRLTFPSFLAGSSSLEQSGSISELFQKDGTNTDTLIQDREINAYIVIVLITVTTVLLLVCYLLFQCFKCQRDVFGKSSSKPSFGKPAFRSLFIKVKKPRSELSWKSGNLKSTSKFRSASKTDSKSGSSICSMKNRS